MKPKQRSFLIIPAATAVLAVLLTGCVFAPQVTQKQPNIPNGGRAVAIAVDPTDANSIVVASESGGLFKSTNRGLNWTQVSGSITFWFTDVTYVPANHNVIIATANADTRVVSGGGIWRSTNGGNTWTRPSITPPTAACLNDLSAYGLAAETGRDRVWAGTLCGLAYSDDQGATWQYLPVATGYNNDKTYAVLAPAAGRLVILTDAGVKISTDDGASWSTASAGLPPYISIDGVHNQIAVSPIDADHLFWAFKYWYYNSGSASWETHVALYRSTNNGASWTSAIDVAVARFNRPLLVRTANALSGGTSQYDIYFGDGSCTLERATATNGSGSTISAWTTLNFGHCDPADIAFSTDHRTPLLLASDGGLSNTSDSGLNWSFVGGGTGGYDALQITEVTGQLHSDPASADLYFATQDNYIWASPDYGATWPAATGGEGFFLNVPRENLPAAETKFTAVSCGGCGNIISGPVLAGVTGFSNPPNDNGNPRLLAPGAYIQNTKISGLTASIFALTTNNGGAWTTRYGFPEEVRDLSKVAGPEADPVVYTAIKVPGVTPNGDEVVQIKRITDVLGSSTPLVSNVDGFGSLGIFPTMFAWYKPFGVDPNDSNYLILSDIVDGQVKVSTDAGAIWTPDTALTNLVTQSGVFKFNWGPFTQTSTFAFDPDCRGHIVVSTRQAGIFQTFDRGGSWTALGGSEQIPDVSSVFFAGNSQMIISSYGRGLWKYTYTCPPPVIHLPPVVDLAEPLIYWKGAKVPISQIHNPDVCPVCGYFLNIGGRVLDYRADAATNQITEVFISGGEIKGYTWDGKALPLPFRVSTGAQQGIFGGDQQLQQLLRGKSQIKGLYVEGNILRGLIVYSSDLSVDQLPKKIALGPHISVSFSGPREASGVEPIVVTGTGFIPGFTIEVLLDGKAVQPDQPARIDDQGNFTITIPPLLDVGGHTILVRQKTDKGTIQDASTFNLTVHDDQ
jgi:hypothetical protein